MSYFRKNTASLEARCGQPLLPTDVLSGDEAGKWPAQNGVGLKPHPEFAAAAESAGTSAPCSCGKAELEKKGAHLKDVLEL
uniref:Uncharacterized protein n=1 Tax=Loa loa TaxID=7209 RepID=A0A1I7VMG1_LOALO